MTPMDKSSRLSMRRRGTSNGDAYPQWLGAERLHATGKHRPGNRRGGPESLRAQILCENIMESGEKKLEMVTLKVHTEAFKKLVGQKVRIPVGAFVAKGAIMFYALRNEAQPISAS